MFPQQAQTSGMKGVIDVIFNRIKKHLMTSCLVAPNKPSLSKCVITIILPCDSYGCIITPSIYQSNAVYPFRMLCVANISLFER